MARLVLLLTCSLATAAHAGDWPRTLTAWLGRSPALDGSLSPGEYDDATPIFGVHGWTPQFTPTTDPHDLSLRGWVKHDGRRLYFAFEVTDDVLYGLDTDRWLPDNNPRAHELSPDGWPWFGDEMELLVNAANQWSQQDNQNAAGDGSSWQMVCNLTKSRLGGIGVGGLLEGEPRVKPSAWANYQRWITSHAMEAVAKPEPGGHGYVIEWAISAEPCLEVRPGVYWSPALGPTRMGLNIAVGDLDDRARGAGNFGNFHHEDWWTGERDKRTWLKQWGTLVLMQGPRPSSAGNQRGREHLR